MRNVFRLPTFACALLAFFAAMVLACGCNDRLRYGASRATVSPDGQKITFGSDHATDGDVYSMGTDGTGLTRLTSGTLVKGCPAMSPDGRSIAYAVQSQASGPCHIFKMDGDGRNPVQVTSRESCDTAPSFSPDGKRIIFARAALRRPYSMGGMAWDHWDVWIMNADGSAQRQLTDQRYYSLDPPYLSPDGTHVLFGATAAQAGGATVTNRLYVFELNPGGQDANPRMMRLDHVDEYEGQPSFSRDGSRIAFIARSGRRQGLFDYDVFTATPEGRDCQQVTHDRSMDAFPVFSSKGDSIYYFLDRTRTGERELWRVGASGHEAAVQLFPK